MDFFKIKERQKRAESEGKVGLLEVYPDFTVLRSKDLMIRAKSFYAIWDESKQLWSQDEFDVQHFVDHEIEAHEVYTPGLFDVQRKYLYDWSSGAWMQFRNYVGHLSDNSHELDENLTFLNQEVKKEDYVSKRLSYALEPGSIDAYSELFGTLYDPEQLAKLEWAIGAIISGDSRSIEKFIVLYGSAGTGKSTWLDLCMKLFRGYYTTFEAKELTSQNNMFSMDSFRSNPLVAIQHDGDLSKISDNSKLNSIISHEEMQINEKNKPSYMIRLAAFLLIGTNTPVRITDSKSGLIRRLIDVQPTGNVLPPKKYQALRSQLEFELGAIAHHCLEVYLEMGKNYYSGYRPVEMMLQTDVFFNFIEAHFDVFSEQDGTTLKQAFALYQEFCIDTGIDYKVPQYKFREELKNYFGTFEERADIDGVRVRSWYSEFKADKFKTQSKKDTSVFSLVMDETESLLDERYKDIPAQYSNEAGNPTLYWNDRPRMDQNGKEFVPKANQIAHKTLADLDTHKEHYVNVEEHEIVIDFDLKDVEGNKSAERNLEAASQWPPTYAEYSKSGQGIHLHYYYTGEPNELIRIYDDGIEIKVFTGDSALRRKLTLCNAVPVATIGLGSLPIKEKKLMDVEQIRSEQSLRNLIKRNLNKEIHPGTKPSMDFIHKILQDAYESEMHYDLTDMRPAILRFANGSSHQAMYCIKLIQVMKFKSDDVLEELEPKVPKDEKKVYFDVEVFPNLFIVCWKYEGSNNVVRMINPTAAEVEAILPLKLTGFFNRNYDNHIIYAAVMGYTIPQLYALSQKLINGEKGEGKFGEAYNLSYTDIYDFANTKMSLKKWEIFLDLPHKENELPWDQPVPPEKWKQVEEYCVNDVNATEAVDHHLAADWMARQLLSDLSGLSLNATTQQHASKIIFGNDSRPQTKFKYTHLDEMFPGYIYEMGKSTYRDEETGEGGYVYSEPGIYTDVALLDVASMHPTSIEALNLFGEYTQNFSDIKAARLAVKHKDYEAAKKMLGGKLARHLNDPAESEALSYALKIVINIVYGLTSATFDNSFRDPRNIDNIVAKRGALFMIDLKHFVQERGFTVAHIKTDSIKIPNATPEIIQEVMDFGTRYGYTFEHEATYEKFCLVNDAVYVAKTAERNNKPGYWVAVGAQFQHPYVFKKLFSHETLKFKDYCETKTVQTALYIDFFGSDIDQPMVYVEGELHFVGKAGAFVPIQPGKGGGRLVREKDGKFYAASGSKGYDWLEAEMVKELHKEKDIDMRYFEGLANDAIKQIEKFGSYYELVGEQEPELEMAA